MKNNAEKPLVRFLSQAGLGSRRYCDTLILDKVVKVNGEVARVGMKVKPGDEVRVKGDLIEEPPVLLYFLLNKPKGYLVAYVSCWSIGFSD